MISEEDLAHDPVVARVREIYSADRKKSEREPKKTLKCTRGQRKSLELSKIKSLTSREKPKQKLQPLVEPLEKPKAKRLQREAGFEHVAIEVNKWTGIVDERKKADQLHFPMEKVDLRVLTSERNYKPTIMTDLEKEVYGLLYGPKFDSQEKKETEADKTIKKAMSLKEIRERSRQIMKDRNLKMRLERKSALINKSKSRKYHKILRRERLKRKKQEFENLKTTDPKAALEILSEIEKTRVKERMDLRHKKSNWLRKQQARAPHDDQVRDLLRENKEMREELLEKLKLQEQEQDDEGEQSDLDEDDDYEENEKLMKIMKNQAQSIKEGKFDPQNAWVSHLAVPNSAAADSKPDLSFYKMKQYWEDRNKEKLRELEALKVVKEYEEKQKEAECDKEVDEVEGDKEVQELVEEEEENDEDENEENINKHCDNKVKITNIEMNKSTIQIKKDVNSKSKISKNKKVENKKQETTKKIKGKNKNLNEDKKKAMKNKTKNIITDTDTKSTKTSKNIKNKPIENKTQIKEKKNNKSEEDFNKNGEKNEEKKFMSVINVRNNESNQPQIFSKIAERKMGSMKHDRGFLKQLRKKLNNDESDSEEDEGFEDILFNDDYVKEFKEEKKSHEESMKLKDIDNFKPGWGSWGGPGIVPSEERKRKFRIKAPKAPRNKYSNIGNVIYNEKADMHENIRKHMVSEVPFPFTSVKDFEASIRQPIGRTFVPELIHKKLIAPSVVTKMGAVIEPMNEECLIKHHEEHKRKESALEKELDEKLRNARGNKKRKNEKELEENKRRKSNKKNKKNKLKAKPLIFL